MGWTGEEKKEFRKAVQNGYRDYGDLEVFAVEECDLRLSEVSGERDTTKATFRLIDHADAQGTLDDLLEAFRRENPQYKFTAEFEAARSPEPEPEEEDCAAECEESGSYLCQAPPVPGYFVPRPGYSNQIRDRLLSAEIDEPGTLVVSAIQGLGGIGKSVLAADLARQLEIRSRFPDGVLWVTLGQTPDLLKLLGGWITALGDREYSATTVDAASAYLRSLLADKTMLLVVDDLWNVDDFLPFRLSGKGCRVLVTTREAKVPGIPERAEVRLGVMSRDEGKQLVEKRLGWALSAADQAVFETFAEKVEYLPLAFDLIASQVSDGYDWLTLLEDFQEEFDVLSVERSGCDEARRLLSLRACFNLSLRRLDREVLRRFAWLGVLPEDVAVDARMTSILWEVPVRVARQQLLDFLRRGLMLSGPKVSVAGRSIPTFRQHDLLHDLATDLLAAPANPMGDGDSLPGLGLSVEVAHGSLLDRYLPESGCWADLVDDGYIHGRLTWHMERAGRVREIHQLIRQAREDGRNAWYEACEELGQLTIFVEDVARAWRLAEETYGIIPTEPEGWEWQMWCAFVTVSLNSLVGNVPAALIAALVEKGVWSEARGLAYAMQKRREGDREDAIAALVPHFSSRELVNEALKAARAMIAGGDRILLAVVKHRQEFVEDPVAIARDISDEYSRTRALCRLADKLTELLPEALQVARDISDESDQASALSSLADKLTVELLPEALQVAREISDEYSRTLALSSLADKRPELLPEAITVARESLDKSSRARALSRLADKAAGVAVGSPPSRP